MARFYLVKLTDQQSKAVFWVSDVVAGCALVVLLGALLCAPYLLGQLPGVDADFARGVE